MDTRKLDLSSVAADAEQVATMLRALANGRRLMILCLLLDRSEMSAGDLARQVGISPSALSQHLARMREEGLVAIRRDGQTMYYRIPDPTLKQLIRVLTSSVTEYFRPRSPRIELINPV